MKTDTRKQVPLLRRSPNSPLPAPPGSNLDIDGDIDNESGLYTDIDEDDVRIRTDGMSTNQPVWKTKQV